MIFFSDSKLTAPYFAAVRNRVASRLSYPLLLSTVTCSAGLVCLSLLAGGSSTCYHQKSSINRLNQPSPTTQHCERKRHFCTMDSPVIGPSGKHDATVNNLCETSHDKYISVFKPRNISWLKTSH